MGPAKFLVKLECFLLVRTSVSPVLTFYGAWDSSRMAREPTAPLMGTANPLPALGRLSCCRIANRIAYGVARVQAVLVRYVVRPCARANLKWRLNFTGMATARTPTAITSTCGATRRGMQKRTD